MAVEPHVVQGAINIASDKNAFLQKPISWLTCVGWYNDTEQVFHSS
jgi:hypothetical protein